MNRCTHNDTSPELEPCKNEGIGEYGYCIEHGCCLCGGVMLADTEDWKVYLCIECLDGLFGAFSGQMLACPEESRVFAKLKQLIDAAYEAGRRSVIGYVEPDEVVEKGRRLRAAIRRRQILRMSSVSMGGFY